MSDRNPPSDPEADPTSFGDWLETTAESRGSSKEELLQQLISSYWTLNEMTEMIGQPEGESSDDPFDQAIDAAVPPDRSEYESFAEEVEEEMSELAQRITTLEAKLEQDSGVSRQEFEQRLDAEFDTLRRILERLISTTNEQGEEIDGLHNRIDHELAGLRDERSDLDHLRRRAMELGVTEASCANCETDVDLSLLPSAACPTCGRTFTDITPKRTFLGIGLGSNELETAPADDRRSRRRDRSGSAEEQPSQQRREADRERDNRIGGFEWEDEQGRRSD